MKLRTTSTEILFTNKWLEVRKAIIGNEEGEKIGEYIYQHAPWSNGLGVAILCYRDVETEGGFSRREYLGRYEICPAHSDEYELCSITGGYDHDHETFQQCAIRELEEEGGYTTSPGHLVHLGTVRPSKASDNLMHIYASCKSPTSKNFNPSSLLFISIGS